MQEVYCKSLDPVLPKCCLENAVSYEIIIDEDIPVLLQYTDELYESEDELSKLVKAGNIYMYHLHNHLIGCGFLTKVINNRNIYDIDLAGHLRG